MARRRRQAARRTGGRGFPSDSQQTQRGAAEFAQTQRCGSAARGGPTIASLESDRPAAPRAGDADGDEAVASTATGGRALGHGCDRHGVADARGERGRAAGERLYYRSLRRQHPADMAKADGRRARGSRGRLSILLSTGDPSPVFTGDSVTPGRSRKPVWAVPSIEGSNPSLSAFVVVRPTALRAPRPGYPPAPARRCFSCSDTVRFLRWHNPSRSAEHAQQPRNPSRKPPRATRRLPPVSRSSLARPRPLILASTRVQYEQSAWVRAAVMQSPHLNGSIRPAGLRGELLGSNAVPPQHSYPWKPESRTRPYDGSGARARKRDGLPTRLGLAPLASRASVTIV